jgi:hypothetical protein
MQTLCPGCTSTTEVCLFCQSCSELQCSTVSHTMNLQCAEGHAGSVISHKAIRTLKNAPCAAAHASVCTTCARLLVAARLLSFAITVVCNMLVKGLPEAADLPLFVSPHSYTPADCVATAVVLHNVLQGRHP